MIVSSDVVRCVQMAINLETQFYGKLVCRRKTGDDAPPPRCLLQLWESTYQREFEEIVRGSANDADKLGVFLYRYETERQNITFGVRSTVFRVAVNEDAMFRPKLEGNRICKIQQDLKKERC